MTLLETPDTKLRQGHSEWPCTFAYWSIAVLVTTYVAATTDFRDEIRTMDGWEHHRAVRVMTEVGFQPGNPTYATHEPSIRYSPYTVALALVSRWTRWNPWRVLSGAAVVNTAALLIALNLLLCAFRRRSAALPVLLVLLLLYGTTPGYANTLALEDLPVHQGNPSAFALPLCLLVWAGWRSARSSRIRLLLILPLTALALAIAVLSHAMTGLLGLLGVASISVCAESNRRQLIVAAVALASVVLALCAVWPFYPFISALVRNPHPAYWYNPFILKLMLTTWCLPAMLASLLALPYRREPLVRFAFCGLIAILTLTALAVATRSATLARLPLAGLIFAQLLTGYVLHRWELLRASTWRDLFSRLGSLSPDSFAPGFIRVLLPGLVLYFGFPQFVQVAREPHLLRSRLSKWFHLPDRRAHLFRLYADVLAPVGERDVVIGDASTSWPVPSFRGRVVAAEHFELFTPDQQRRFDDAELFMAPGTPLSTRLQLVDRYAASWILLDRRADARVLPELLVPAAVARDAGDLILMNAARWRQTTVMPTVVPQ